MRWPLQSIGGIRGPFPAGAGGGGGGSAPVNTVAPVISSDVSGEIFPARTLSTTNGTWTNSPTGYTYQWKRNGGAISGATSSTYTLVTADEGASITCDVTASNGAGSATQASNALTCDNVVDHLFSAGESGFWLDPADASTMWQDTAATTAAGDGDVVGRIDDKSGNAENFTQGTASLKPVRHQDVSGNWYIAFDADDQLASTNGLGNVAALTLGIAYNLTKTTGVLLNETTGKYLSAFDDGSTDTTLSAAASTDSRYIDGALDSSANRGDLENALLAGNVVVEQWQTTSIWFNTTKLSYGGSGGFTNVGEIYQMVLVDRDLTATEREGLEYFLAEKVGVTL